MKKRRSLQALKHALYTRKKYFQKFDNITEEKYKEILNKVKKFTKHIEKEIVLPELYFYMDALAYITEPPNSNEMTYDEKIIFLIETIDPNLITLKIHNEIETITAVDVKIAKTSEEKQELLDKKTKESELIENKVREELKVYDRNLALYEKYYSAKIKNKKKFEEPPNKDLSPLILSESANISFENISEERYEEINKIAQNWIAITNDEGNNKRSAYNIIYQNNLLNLKTKTEQIIFYILTVDPNLSALTILYENANWKQIKEDMIQTIGFYSKDLIMLEKKYHERFIPTKILSEYQKIKSN